MGSPLPLNRLAAQLAFDGRFAWAALSALAVVLAWNAFVLAPVQVAERERIERVAVVEDLQAALRRDVATDEESARAFLLDVRRVLPSLERVDMNAADRLRAAARRLEDALMLGRYEPSILTAALADFLAVERSLAQASVLGRERELRSGEVAVWSLYVLIAVALVVLIVAYRDRRRRALDFVLDQERLGKMLFAISPEAVAIADLHEKIVAVNPAYCRATGYDAQEVIGRSMHFNCSGEQDERFFASMRRELAIAGRWTGEIWQRRKTGEAYAEKVTRIAIADDRKRPSGFLSVSMDITASKDAERLINWQAQHDGLTKLPNRTLLTERLSRVLVHRRIANVHGALLTLDIDRFKRVNETVGPPVGDRLLIEAAMRVAMSVAESDTVARLGSDEFAVLMPEIEDEAEVERLGRRLLERLREPFAIDGHELFVTASLGAALFPQDGSDPAGLIQTSNVAMARAKESGGNALVFYQREMNARAGRHLEIESELRRALKEDQLLLLFQPIVAPGTGSVVSVEALMRWKHPQWGMVEPAEFIPVAEDSGLVVEMGLWLVAEAGRALERLSRAGLTNLRVSLNISARQLEREEDLDALLDAVCRGRAERMTLEITESFLMNDAARVNRFMETLHRAGARVALDDFGTGYSSLSYLRQFRFDVLKVDRSFIREIERSNTDLSLVAAIVSMGRILGAEVVVEGVENATQLAALRSVGCELIQGYHYARPMDLERLIEFVAGFKA